MILPIISVTGFCYLKKITSGMKNSGLKLNKVKSTDRKDHSEITIFLFG